MSLFNEYPETNFIELERNQLGLGKMWSLVFCINHQNTDVEIFNE